MHSADFRAFVAHGFQPAEQRVAEQLIRMFRTHGVEPTTGERPEVRQIPEKVTRLIREADALIAIVHRRTDGGTSRWVDQEIGYALGCNKLVLWFIEEESGEISGIEGKLEYVPFSTNRDGVKENAKLRERIACYLQDASEQVRALLYADTIFRQPSAVDFAEVLRRTHKRMFVAGIAMQPIVDLCHPDIAEKVCRERHFSATIVLSDPRAWQPRQREIDERVGKKMGQMAADVAKIALRYLTDETLREALRSRRLRVLFFTRYPTIATAVFDDELYAYFYAYHARGTESPMLHFRDLRRNACAKFFWRHMTEVVEASRPMRISSLNRL